MQAASHEDTARGVEAFDRRLGLVSLAVGLGCLVLLLATSPGLPMVWDEGNAIRRADCIRRWAGRWFDAGPEGRASVLTEATLQADWPYTTRLEGHPALYGILIALGRSVADGWLAPLQAARFGPMVFFSLAVGAFYYRLARQFSHRAALGTAAALVLLPRLFAHAHFASFDGPLTSAWMLSYAAFAPARGSRRWAVVFGLALGAAFSCKATGLLAPLPFVLWAILYRDRRAACALALALPVALVTFVAMNPPLWHDPAGGFGTFLALNLGRAARPGLNISTWFLGRMYNLDHPLPWYNTLFWTAVTVPLALLFLLGVGLAGPLRRPRRERDAMLLLAGAAVLLVARALPGVPPHDGVRQFLPSFAFLAALIGLGADRMVGWLSARTGGGRLGSLAVVGGLYLASATSLVWYGPHWLSYYNLAIGGLRGATAAGMEPTYYWDGLDREVLDWLHAHTLPAEKIRFAAGPDENLELMRRWGLLGRGFRPSDPGAFHWYVLQHRPSAWSPADRRLFERGTPVMTRTIRPGGVGPWKLDVPLVMVYPYGSRQQAAGSRQQAAGSGQ